MKDKACLLQVGVRSNRHIDVMVEVMNITQRSDLLAGTLNQCFSTFARDTVRA